MAIPIDITIAGVLSGEAPFDAALTPTGVDPDDGTVTFTIDWGDGTNPTVVTSGVPAEHTYDHPGLYTVTYTAAVGVDEADPETVAVTVYASTFIPSLDLPEGVCTPWFTVDDMDCHSVPAHLREAAMVEATRWLFDATCRLWPGTCTSTIRPHTEDRCTSFINPAVPHRLDLTRWVKGPIRNIVDVHVDGQPIDRTWFWLENNRWLVSSDGFGDEEADSPLIPWPRQIPQRQLGGVGTWSVTVEHGADPPPPLVRAAVTLACETVKQCTGDDTCVLPDNATSVTREGVTIRLAQRQEGKVGVPFIDNMLEQYGCASQRARARRLHDPLAPRAQVSRLRT